MAEKGLKEEVIHFTESPEIQHFTVEKLSKDDNAYGTTWGNLIREYLMTVYPTGNTRNINGLRTAVHRKMRKQARLRRQSKQIRLW